MTGPRGADITIGATRGVPSARALRTGVWLVGSFAITAAAFLPALVVGDSMRPDFGGSANVVFFGSGSLAWLLLSFAGAVVLARLLSLGPVGDAWSGAIVVASLLAGTGLCLAYGGWSQAGYGSSDPDELGIGILLPAAAVLCALYAGLGAVTVRPASAASLAVSALAYGVIALIGALNLPGLGDGLSSEGVLMAAGGIALGAVLAWAVIDQRTRGA